MTERMIYELTFWLLVVSLPGLLCIAGYGFYALTSKIRVWWHQGCRVFSYEGDNVQIMTFIKRNRD